jgi:hypothetical protein
MNTYKETSILFSTNTIIKPNEKSVQTYLYNSLKNQCTWRDNKSDAINDQIKFFESYLGKEALHIDKELITNKLVESETSSNQGNINKNKNKFLNLIPLNSQFESEFTEFMICFFDTENSSTNSNFLNFDLKTLKTKEHEELDELDELDQLQLLMKDELRLNLNFDTNLRSSRVIQNAHENCSSSLLVMDMYSIYNINIHFLDDLEMKKFDKNITLDEIPNFFLSEFFCDRFFVTSHSEINTQFNSISLISNDFKTISKKLIENVSGGLKGEFINHPMNVLINSEDSILLLDFRVKFYIN